jgi:hypothetical protein
LNAPKEKAPGPDGFIDIFFSTCWEVVNVDLMHAIDHFFSLNQQGLHLLNQAYIVLIPKKKCPQKNSEYKHISLINSFANIISKILANRLRPELDNLISTNQTTFIQNDAYTIALFLFKRSLRGCIERKFPLSSSN